MHPFSRIKHICFDVEDIEAAEAALTRVFGVKSTGITSMYLDGGKGVVKNTFFRLDRGTIELAYHDLPESWKDSPINRGPGFHHVAFEVQDFDEALSELKAQGVTPLPNFPVETPHGRVAFFDPEKTGGILIELGETEKP